MHPNSIIYSVAAGFIIESFMLSALLYHLCVLQFVVRRHQSRMCWWGTQQTYCALSILYSGEITVSLCFSVSMQHKHASLYALAQRGFHCEICIIERCSTLDLEEMVCIALI